MENFILLVDNGITIRDFNCKYAAEYGNNYLLPNICTMDERVFEKHLIYLVLHRKGLPENVIMAMLERF